MGAWEKDLTMVAQLVRPTVASSPRCGGRSWGARLLTAFLGCYSLQMRDVDIDVYSGYGHGRNVLEIIASLKEIEVRHHASRLSDFRAGWFTTPAQVQGYLGHFILDLLLYQF